MNLGKFTVLTSSLWLVCHTLGAETLTFIAQPLPGGGVDVSWFNSQNWFTTDITGAVVGAGRVPLVNESAVITGTVDLGASGVRVQDLLLTNNASISNGTLAVENLELLTGSSIKNANVNVLSVMIVGGTDCTLSGASLGIVSITSVILQPIAPATKSTLILDQGSFINNSGAISLTAGSQIVAGGPPQSTILIENGGSLISTDSSAVVGSPNNHLLFDNSGTVRADGGSLTFANGIDWQCSSGTGEFRATTLSAVIEFRDPFSSDAGITTWFTGLGTNRWLAGAHINGVAQVSALNPSTELAGNGNLEIMDSVLGSGRLHLFGTTNLGGAGSWQNGTIALPSVTVDPGSSFVIGGTAATSRVLSGCNFTNFGQCILSGGDLSMNQGSQFNNQPASLVLAQGEGAIVSPDGTATFNNAGTFKKLDPGIFQFAENTLPSPAFNNTGLVDVQNGQIYLAAGQSSGEFRQNPGTLIWFWGGTHVFEGGASFTGTTQVRVAAGLQSASCVLHTALSVAQLEIGAQGSLAASGVPASTPEQIGSLILDEDGVIGSGTYQIQKLQMLDQSSVVQASVGIAQYLYVGGTNCVFDQASVTLPPGSAGLLASSNPPSIAKLTLSGGAELLIGGELTLANASMLTSAGPIQSSVHVQPPGILVSTNGSLIFGSASGPMVFDHSGLVRVDQGALEFGTGLEWQSASGIGEFQAAGPSTQIAFTGPLNVPAGVTGLFTGLGTNSWLGGGLVNGVAQVGATSSGAQAARPGNLQINSSLAGSGSIHVLGVTGTQMNWNDGTLNVSHINTDAGSSLMMGGAAVANRHLAGCVLNNSGECVFTGGDVTLDQGSAINNLPSGTIRVTTPLALKKGSGATAVAISNAGTFFCAAGGGQARIDLDFANAGLLEITSGSLAFNGTWEQTQGSTIIHSSSALIAAKLNVLGGALTGAGIIVGNLFNVAGNVSASTPPGILTIVPGQSYQQSSSGTLAVTIGGPAGSDYGKLLIAGSDAVLDGQLAIILTNGFTPQPGQVFEILAGNSVSGRFRAILNMPIGSSTWVPRYTTTNVTVRLANDVLMGRPSLSGNSLQLSINTTAGVFYVVEATDQLSSPSWQVIDSFAGDGSLRLVTDSANLGQRFYHVLLQ